MRAIIKTFWFRFLMFGLVAAMDNGLCRTIVPFLVSRLVAYFTDGTIMEVNEAYLCAVLMVGFVFLNVLLRNHYTLWCSCIGMRVRVACCSVVYRKILRFTKFSMEQTATGNIVNLLSNDVSRFDVAGKYFHWIWVSLIQVIATTIWLWFYMGVSAVIGVAAIVLSTVPVQGYLGKVAARLRRKIASRTDNRMKLMNEIMSGVQVIKMYAWEKPFAVMVSVARQYEIGGVTLAAYLRAVLLSAVVFSEKISVFAALFSYWMFGFEVLPYQMFTLAIYINFLNISLAIYYPMGISAVAEAYVSMKRLQDFLLKEEGVPKPKATVSPGVILLCHVNSQWSPEHSTISDINLDLKPGHLCGIIGPVGSGKSSLLHVLLHELPITSGTMSIGGKVAYSSQEPWIFGGTVRQNILFGCPYDATKYQEVVKVCALKRDFVLLPLGDETIVGEKGITLSGGQRARINLARAVYQEADIYLLDDPLSAVDTLVGKHLFDECINGYLKNKTRILVTHQLHYLKKADLLVILKEGKIDIQGTIQYVMAKNPSLAATFKSDSKEDSSQITEYNAQKMVAVRKQSKYFFSELNSTNDSVTSGKTRLMNYWKYFRAGAGPCFMIITLFAWLLSQALRSIADYWMSIWSNGHAGYSGIPSQDTPNSYLTSLGDEIHLTVYGILVLACCIVSIIRSMLIFKICMTASSNLHSKMFSAILRAKMRFFDTNPSGTILNRFSRDVGAMDEQLPNAFVWMNQIFFIVIGTFAVILAIKRYLVAVVLVTWIVMFFAIKFLMQAPKKLKALEARTRRPLFSHLADSLNGLVTIRASNSQSEVKRLFHIYQNSNTSASFWFLSTSMALGFYLDTIVAIFIGIVTLIFFLTGNDNFKGSDFGLAISQALALTGMLQTGILQLTEVVSQMTSVSRILEYTNVESEPALESSPGKTPPKDWPSMGKIQLSNVYLKYCEDMAPVLKNLNFVVEQKHKVGVVGRTGAGKSSLLSVLFRLANVEGTVLIDDVDTGTIGLHDLRKRISIIPQEPVLFSATMRYNLDPFNEFEDATLWDALEEVKLKEAVESLDWQLSEGGSNLSIGQRQLVCLARAILRNNHILVLDEATANVDPGTDQLIQETIRRKFKNCTVITIAHRLNTIIDSDRVLVMDAGTVVEYDHPYKLLLDQNGHFFRMVHETGNSMAEFLMTAAELAYRTKEETSCVT
ncbi:ATP-binding cassette sub-family C member 4 isoform X2 [Anabrus simplex]